MLNTKMIGNKIAEARKKKNISQAQLAQQLFISAQAVGKWERGESMPDITTFNSLAEVLDVDLNYFSESFPSTNRETAAAVAHEGAGDQTAREEDDPSRSPERSLLLTNFSGSALAETDFAGVSAPERKFNGSNLRGADFSGADLTGSSFTGSDLREASFDGTNLTDCTLSANNLTDASFNKTILVRTRFSSSELSGVKFTDVQLIDVKLTATDLTKTIFKDCTFNGVDFKSSDLSGLRLDGQTFTNVKFDRAALTGATFAGATLRNVSFRPSYALTNKYYRALQTICFDGAMIDKLSYIELKSFGVDLSKATVI